MKKVEEQRLTGFFQMESRDGKASRVAFRCPRGVCGEFIFAPDARARVWCCGSWHEYTPPKKRGWFTPELPREKTGQFAAPPIMPLRYPDRTATD
jgi:hypothetical protein